MLAFGLVYTKLYFRFFAPSCNEIMTIHVIVGKQCVKRCN